MFILERKLIEWGVENVLTKLAAALAGKKTYILAGLGIVVGLVGHFFGPIDLGAGIIIPTMGWADVWNIVWNGGLFATLRAGVAKAQ